MNFFIPTGKLEPRHSTVTGNTFNFLLSDLDLTGILKSCGDSATKDLKEYVQSWKRVLPFVGELEIYDIHEKVNLDSLLSKHKTTYETLRRFRKVWWMEYAISIAPTKYHKFKALRAIQTCLNAVAPGVIARETGNLQQISPFLNAVIIDQFKDLQISFDLSNLRGLTVQCPYMGSNIALNENATDDNALHLSPRAGLLLFAISPVDTRNHQLIDPIIDELRKIPLIYNLWSGLSQIELLIFTAFMRSQVNVSPDFLRWEKCLQDSVKLAQLQRIPCQEDVKT